MISNSVLYCGIVRAVQCQVLHSDKDFKRGEDEDENPVNSTSRTGEPFRSGVMEGLIYEVRVLCLKLYIVPYHVCIGFALLLRDFALFTNIIPFLRTLVPLVTRLSSACCILFGPLGERIIVTSPLCLRGLDLIFVTWENVEIFSIYFKNILI